MSVQLAGRNISRIAVVDDDKEYRALVVSALNEVDVEAVPIAGPLFDLDESVAKVQNQAQAAVCDFRLTKIGQYARVNGCEIVAELYKRKFPGIVCSQYYRSDIFDIRHYRPFIPTLLPAVDATDPANVMSGIARCIREIDGDCPPSRKPWRSLIRVLEVHRDIKPMELKVVLPGWNSREAISLPLEIIPQEQRDMMERDYRFHARVNIGAVEQNELYFRDFEFD